MRKFLFSIIRIIVSWAIGLVTLGIVYFALNVSFMISAIIGVGFYYLTSLLLKKKFSKKTEKDIEREKLIYRKNELHHARVKIYKIGKSRFKIRSVHMWQTVTKIYKMLLKMVALVENEPDKFRSAQSFFTIYLDSLITIVDKYALLAAQPVKNHDIRLAIKKTEETLEEMARTLEHEMLTILESDVLDLDVELNVLKQSLDDTTATMNHLGYSKVKGE